MNADNVIPLNPSKGPAASMSPNVAPLIRNCRGLVQRHLEPLVQRMFTSADDTLFEYANKTELGRQVAFMDAMRELRLKRREMEERLRQSLDKAFRKFEQEEPGADKPSFSEFGLDSLSLVDESELEESLAVNGMAEKARSGCAQDLMGLELRLAECIGLKELKNDADPFGPEAVARAFRDACGLLDAGLEVKLIIYKLFERAVMSQLGPMYREANAMLLEAGILPKLKATSGGGGSGQRPPAAPGAKAAGTGAGAAAAGGTPGEAAPAGAEEAGLLGMLHDFLAQMRVQSGWAPLPVASPGVAVEGNAGELMHLLSSMQIGTVPGTGEGVAPQGLELRQALGGMLGKQNVMLGSREADVIDLVSMLFEFILDDPNLPDSVKVLLGRLQIPYIKVALLDGEFLGRKNHPARRLLNDLARAGVGVDPLAKADENPRLNKIRAIVEQVLVDFEEDLGLFESLIRDLSLYLEQEAAAESSVAEVTLGEHRKREQREQTRAEVQKIVGRALSELTAPEPIMAVLRGPWLEVLVETRIRDGEGAEWRERLSFIDELVWSVRPRRSPAERQVLAKNLPKLLRRLAQGLDLLGYSMEERKAILKALEPYHLACLRGQTYEEPPAPAPAPAAAPAPGPKSAPAVEPKAAAAAPAPAKKGSGEFDSVIAEMEAQLANLAKLEELLSAEPDLPVEEAPMEPLEEPTAVEEPLIDDEFLARARGVKVGTWVEFKEASGARRTKLAWKSDLLGDFTFVNWKFQVVAEKSLAGFAADLRSGAARIIEEVPVLDRALDAVVQRLRRGAAPA